ncbi:MAG: hypothetical protein FJX68_12595 [Alphaproteobacteria bacterium]|nr:hypothetical protein [Alphaproteobacteria bacterium]
MATPGIEDTFDVANPLDVVEELVSSNQWPFDRTGDDELSVCVQGSWCDYNLGFSFAEGQGTLQVACAYDTRIPKHRLAEVHALLALVNERMFLGHFDVWSEDGTPMFRHALLVRGGPAPTPAQVGAMIDIALSECERYYPAFQYVLWGGKSAREAMDAAMLETQGEA